MCFKESKHCQTEATKRDIEVNNYFYKVKEERNMSEQYFKKWDWKPLESETVLVPVYK